MATDALTQFHETWLGMVRPVDGLVVSVPVLVEAGCSRPEASIELQQRLLALCPPEPEARGGRGSRPPARLDWPADSDGGAS